MNAAHVRTAMIMGLPWSIHVRSSPERRPTSADVDQAAELVWTHLRHYDRIFSPFRPDSDLNALIADPTASVDPALAEVLGWAVEAQQITGGLFDIRGAGRLDPSGLVKGWAGRSAARELDRIHADYYLNCGGDITVHTESSDARPWRIGVEHPGDPRSLVRIVELRNGAIATSGGVHRGSHLWDPRTGGAARSAWQATVVGADLVLADVLATAAAVAGPDDLDRSAWPAGYEVMFAHSDGTVRATREFPRCAPSSPSAKVAT